MDPQTHERAAQEIVAALHSLGLAAHLKYDEPELILVLDGEEILLLVEPRAVMRPTEVPALSRPDAGFAGVVVSDRVSEAARAWLRRQQWGWLDRRGHFRFWYPPGRIMIETELPAGVVREPQRSAANPFAPTGLGIAVELLFEPEKPLAVRETATRLGVSAGHVSLVLSTLREQGLVDRSRRPLVPDLFWALAEHWHAERISLSRLPPAHVEDRELRIAQWVLGGDVAAARWGAPIVLTEKYPPDLYVPTRSVVQTAIHRFGEAAVAERRAATLQTMPTTRIVDTAVRRRGRWLLAHPVIVALDLARDLARGREVLDAWTPSDGFRRVW